MKTVKNNKRKSRRGSIKRGGMFGRLFRRTQLEPQLGHYTEHHPHYSVANSSTRARNTYTGKNANAYVVPNALRPTQKQIKHFEYRTILLNALKPYKMNKIDIETYGTPIVIDKNGYIDTTVNKKVCLLMNTLDYGLVYDYRSLGKDSYYLRFPPSITKYHIIYPSIILPTHLSKDMKVYEIPEQIIKGLHLNAP
jgi:hypothetical protein